MYSAAMTLNAPKIGQYFVMNSRIVRLEILYSTLFKVKSEIYEKIPISETHSVVA